MSLYIELSAHEEEKIIHVMSAAMESVPILSSFIFPALQYRPSFSRDKNVAGVYNH